MRKISSQEAEAFMILLAELEGCVSPFSWSLPPSELELSSHDVHIWLAELNSITMHVQQMAQCLYENEHLRAECFHFKRDKRRFIILPTLANKLRIASPSRKAMLDPLLTIVRDEEM